MGEQRALIVYHDEQSETVRQVFIYNPVIVQVMTESGEVISSWRRDDSDAEGE